MLRLYNTRTRSVETFSPVRDGEVRMYVCGLTPSAEPHLGHARSFLFFDVLRAYLKHLGYHVTYVQNVTDVDDRSIEAARALGVPWSEIVQRYYASFKNSMRLLGVAEPDIEPRATEYVPQIVAMIGRLIEAGHAYVTGDGVYFRVSSFPAYGKLSGKQIDELLIGARIAENERKLDPLDFALWKLEKPGEPSWPSPWGAGRPGWHIECSAMAHELLGEPLDIHGGGTDLIFPHHENEIAQSESLLAHPPMADVWVHGGMLNFEQRKMSKSLGNYEPLAELLERSDPQAIRLLFLQTGYRKPMNFTEDSLAAATSALGKLRRAFRVLCGGRMPSADASDFEGIIERVEGALDDDMNTSSALAVLFDVAAKAEAYASSGDSKAAANAFAYALELLRIVPNETWLRDRQIDVEIVAARLRERLGEVALASDGSGTIDAVIAARDEARRTRNFALADRLRDALAAEQIELHDTRDGTTWTLAGG